LGLGAVEVAIPNEDGNYLLRKDNFALMLMPASSEFTALCRSQVTLLSQVLGAALSVVYLTDDMIDGEQAKLIPIVAYPDSDVVWEDHQDLRCLPSELPGETAIEAPIRGFLSAAKSSESSDFSRSLPEQESLTDGSTSYQNNAAGSQSLSRQLVLPLIHEEVVMGLLVTTRPDRPWSSREVSQIERIANTLAIARILDRRGDWLEKQLRQKQLIQSQQQDLLDNLLHQLRSPLTALRTFGKLMLNDSKEKIRIGKLPRIF
jgi:GAF domain-containing protein